MPTKTEADWEIVTDPTVDNNGHHHSHDLLVVEVDSASSIRKEQDGGDDSTPASLQHLSEALEVAAIYDKQNQQDDDDDDEIVTERQLTKYRNAFDKDVTARVAQNAVCQTSIWQIALSRKAIQQDVASSPFFSINLDRGGMPATNQQDSGRCWLFATLNLLRFDTRENLSVDDFEFSESYLYFYHILEQCNTFLEVVIETLDEPITNNRILEPFLETPIDDGGDWQIAINLLDKYGIVPKSIFPESETSNNTDAMISYLGDLLRSSAWRMRKQQQENHSNSSQQHLADEEKSDKEAPSNSTTIKAQTMANIWRILCIHLGTPPQQFDWQWRSYDDDDTFHRRINMTPKAFCQEFVTTPYSTYISVIQDPRHEYYQRYTVDHSTTVLGGAKTIFLNLPAEEMKTMCQDMLQDGLPVFFACNVEIQSDESIGLWDAQLYDREALYGISSNATVMNKADRIRYGGCSMGDHAMLFTGVDITAEKKNRRWRVENSWGTDYGNDGYFTMKDDWFDDNVFEITAPPHYFSEQAAAGLQTKPIVLPAWDPMFSVGGRRRR